MGTHEGEPSEEETLRLTKAKNVADRLALLRLSLALQALPLRWWHLKIFRAPLFAVGISCVLSPISFVVLVAVH